MTYIKEVVNISANNYTLIHKIGKKYYAWYGLNAEEAVVNNVLTPANADKCFDTLEQAIDWANENDHTEYGYKIDSPYKPKDGFREIIKEK